MRYFRKASAVNLELGGARIFKPQGPALGLNPGAVLLFLLSVSLGVGTAQASNADCGLPGVVYCVDWEKAWAGQTAQGVSLNVDGPADATCNSIDTTQSQSGTHSNLMVWGPNGNSCSFYYLNLTQIPLKTKDIYVRWYQYMSDGWNCTDPGHESKDFIVYGSREPSGDYGTGFQLQLGDGNFGTCGLGFRPIRMKSQWDMMFYQNQGHNVDFSVNPTRWYCIETRVRVNDLGSSNGVIQAWVDNVLVMEYTGMDLSPGDDYFREVQGTGSKINVSSNTIRRWTDDLVVGTQRIGCQASGAPQAPASGAPQAPSNLSVN